MLRRIHVHERGLTLGRFLPSSIELGKSRPAALFGQARICQDAANVFVLDDEPGMTSIPELNLGDGFLGTKTSIFCRWLRGFGTRERETGRIFVVS